MTHTPLKNKPHRTARVSRGVSTFCPEGYIPSGGFRRGEFTAIHAKTSRHPIIPVTVKSRRNKMRSVMNRVRVWLEAVEQLDRLVVRSVRSVDRGYSTRRQKKARCLLVKKVHRVSFTVTWGDELYYVHTGQGSLPVIEKALLGI